MAIRNLLVAYNGGKASDAALRFAVQMSGRHDAHLTGVLAHGVSRVSRNIPAWFSPEMRDSITGAIAQKAAAIKGRFRAAAAEVPEGRLHWIEVGGDPDQTISDYAMLHDFVIVGQYENLVEADELELHPNRIARGSGRPVLMIPRAFESARFDGRVVLAWDGNKAAMRALSDALLVLEPTDDVTVATVVSTDVGQPLPGIDVTTVLSRHGIRSERILIPHGGKPVAETLLGLCKDVDAGLLVMGARERTGFGKDLVGGVAGTIIVNATVPVLMSH